MSTSLLGGLFVGTYARSGGEGIYPVLGDPPRLGEPFRAAPNCSFAAFDRSRALGYFVDEQDDGLVRTCRLAGSGWELFCEHASGGSQPCYVSLNPSRSRLAVANYGSGSVGLFTLDPHSGLPAGDVRAWQASGSGPVADRQDKPHIHCVAFAGEDLLYAVDLGTDRIFGFDLGANESLTDPFVAFPAPPGSGPRHLAFHPRLPLAYLLSELAGTVTTLDCAGPGFKSIATTVIHPAAGKENILGGHLSLDAAATHLYATVRGDDSIAVFGMAPDGSLTRVQHVATQGASPRSFALLEQHGVCAVANEEGQSVALLPIEADGLGEAVDVIPAPGAAFVFEAALTHKDR